MSEADGSITAMGKRRAKKPRQIGGPRDVHADAIAQGLQEMVDVYTTIDPERSVSDLDDRISAAISRMATLVARFQPLAVVEQAR